MLKICNIALFLIILLLFNLLYSQNSDVFKIDKIKSDNLYIWGEGEAEDRNDAQKIAESDLLSKIQISINVATFSEQKERETQEGITFVDDFQKKHKSFTGMYLKGLDRIVTRTKKQWYVLTFIHIDDLKESFQLRKEKIRSYVVSGENSACQGRIGDALRNYYWGYLLALTYPDTIIFLSIKDKESNSPQVAITSMIKELIDEIDIVADICYQDGQIVMAPLNFQYKEIPIKNLTFSYYSGMGTDYGLVEEGHTEIPLYDKPSSSTRKLTLKIEYVYENEMTTDQEVLNLYDIFKENKFSALKSINISFPWIKSIPKPVARKKVSTNIEALTKTEPFKIPNNIEVYKIITKTEAIDVLKKRTEIRDFLDVLAQYKKLGIIDFGRRSDFGNGKDCFVAIADENSVVEILYYNGDTFVNTTTNDTFLDLAQQFKGKRQIWIKEMAN